MSDHNELLDFFCGLAKLSYYSGTSLSDNNIIDAKATSYSLNLMNSRYATFTHDEHPIRSLTKNISLLPVDTATLISESFVASVTYHDSRKQPASSSLRLYTVLRYSHCSF